MILLNWRVFSVALLLAVSLAMPGVIKAQTQMTEIPLSSGGGGGAQSMAAGSTVLDGGGAASTTSTLGPEAVTFDGTYVWVATQFNDSVTRIRVSDGTTAGTFARHVHRASHAGAGRIDLPAQCR